MVVGREVVDSKLFSAVVKLGLIAHEAVVGNLISAIQTVEQVERFGGEFEAPSVAGVQLARQAHVGAGIVRADEGITPGRGEAVVVAVVVLVGVADYCSIDGAATAGGDDAGVLPVFREFAEQALAVI